MIIIYPDTNYTYLEFRGSHSTLIIDSKNTLDCVEIEIMDGNDIQHSFRLDQENIKDVILHLQKQITD